MCCVHRTFLDKPAENIRLLLCIGNISLLPLHIPWEHTSHLPVPSGPDNPPLRMAWACRSDVSFLHFAVASALLPDTYSCSSGYNLFPGSSSTGSFGLLYSCTSTAGSGHTLPGYVQPDGGAADVICPAGFSNCRHTALSIHRLHFGSREIDLPPLSLHFSLST